MSLSVLAGIEKDVEVLKNIRWSPTHREEAGNSARISLPTLNQYNVLDDDVIEDDTPSPDTEIIIRVSNANPENHTFNVFTETGFPEANQIDISVLETSFTSQLLKISSVGFSGEIPTGPGLLRIARLYNIFGFDAMGDPLLGGEIVYADVQTVSTFVEGMTIADGESQFIEVPLPGGFVNLANEGPDEFGPIAQGPNQRIQFVVSSSVSWLSAPAGLTAEMIYRPNATVDYRLRVDLII